MLYDCTDPVAAVRSLQRRQQRLRRQQQRGAKRARLADDGGVEGDGQDRRGQDDDDDGEEEEEVVLERNFGPDQEARPNPNDSLESLFVQYFGLCVFPTAEFLLSGYHAGQGQV